jgi:hypothetical protein
MNGWALFNQHGISDVIEDQKRKIGPRVLEIPANKILNASEYDLVQALVQEAWMDVPVINEEGIYIEQAEETQVDVSMDPARIIHDRSHPFYVTGHETTIAVPFTGDSDFFQVQPNRFSLSPPHAEIRGDALLLRYVTTNQDGAAIRAKYLAAVSEIKEYLRRLSEVVDPHNQGLETLISTAVRARKAKLLADANMVEAIGLPLNRREGVSATYTVPVRRRVPKVEEIVVTDAFQPEPTLAMAEYEEILQIIKNMATVMELSPGAFLELDEESLRFHFLVQLNGVYQGQATGETFNSEGKTDILIRVKGRNVFISECKFWDGEKLFLETIDQLLEKYLTWRDTKVAVVIFNRNADFDAVLGKVVEVVPNHPCFKRAAGVLDETTFRYVFKQPANPNREIILTVMAFNVPQAA